MWERIKKSLNEGVKVVRWIAAFLAERTKAEASVAKLLYESNKLERKIDDLYRDIGRRMLVLRENKETAVFEDFIVQQAAAEIKSLQAQVDENRGKAKTLNKLPE